MTYSRFLSRIFIFYNGFVPSFKSLSRFPILWYTDCIIQPNILIISIIALYSLVFSYNFKRFTLHWFVSAERYFHKCKSAGYCDERYCESGENCRFFKVKFFHRYFIY